MAHLRSIVSRCKCGKQATEVLYSSRNEVICDYCTRCAKLALKRRQDAEDRWAREHNNDRM